MLHPSRNKFYFAIHESPGSNLAPHTSFSEVAVFFLTSSKQIPIAIMNKTPTHALFYSTLY